MCVCVCLYVCYPLYEIQAKVSQSNYELTSIKIIFQPFISLSFQSLTWPYFSQNVLYHMKDDFFVVVVENSKSQKSQKSFFLWKYFHVVLFKILKHTKPQIQQQQAANGKKI